MVQDRRTWGHTLSHNSFRNFIAHQRRISVRLQTTPDVSGSDIPKYHHPVRLHASTVNPLAASKRKRRGRQDKRSRIKQQGTSPPPMRCCTLVCRRLQFGLTTSKLELCHRV